MVVNQDEAIRCLSIAKNKLAQGDYEAALKFTNKSLKLHYSKEAELFLERLESDGESPRQNSRNANSANANDSYPTSDNLRRRKESKDEGNTSSKANYTAAQLQSVKQILSIKHDYYKVLSLEKGCEEVEIKKSYRKLALQFHPDKNKAPGADEAFKVVSAAFTTLSDPDKRAHYDRFGSADGNAGASRATNMNFRRGPEGAQFFEGEVTPEELFNMFFGGGMHSGNPFHTTSTHTFRMPRRRQGQGYYTRNGADAGEDKQTILLSNVIGTFLSADSGAKYYPDFSFTPSKKLNTKRTTNRNNIKYYVNFNQFAKNKRSNLSKFDLKSFEKHVEGNYINILNTECQNQRIRKNSMINDAYGFLGLFVDEDKLKMAKEMSLPACDELSRLYY